MAEMVEQALGTDAIQALGDDPDHIVHLGTVRDFQD